ncbi:MAG: S-methyl-5'-thioadenosine phosphorylase [Planctomycetes bacterium]|nr:S-methyl-5'-thioadenosine phosphorylase [Planctomycetota bacterium]
MAKRTRRTAPIVARIGVIGGSGLYDIPGARVLAELRPRTAWGSPSDAITVVEIGGTPVAFLPRHGRGHRLLPGEVNGRANIAALKQVGVEQVIAFSAVGSLKESLAPLDFAVPAQVIDRTRHRPDTFFGAGVVGHVAFADPFCPRLAAQALAVIRAAGLPGGHGGETLVCMEGPLFSTRAESHLYRSFGAGLINMSALPEAKLAREAELCYALVCMVTDYDCWREGESDVDIQMVIANLTANAQRARDLLPALLPAVGAQARACRCGEASRFAVITAPELQPAATRKRLATLLPQYFAPLSRQPRSGGRRRR